MAVHCVPLTVALVLHTRPEAKAHECDRDRQVQYKGLPVTQAMCISVTRPKDTSSRPFPVPGEVTHVRPRLTSLKAVACLPDVPRSSHPRAVRPGSKYRSHWAVRESRSKLKSSFLGESRIVNLPAGKFQACQRDTTNLPARPRRGRLGRLGFQTKTSNSSPTHRRQTDGRNSSFMSHPLSKGRDKRKTGK
jgi:hypothetical protein